MGGRPLLSWVVEVARAAGCAPIHVVVGDDGEEVRAALEDREAGAGDLRWVKGRSVDSMGQALLAARESLEAGDEPVLVLPGEAPLVRPVTLRAMHAAARDGWASLAVAEVTGPSRLRTVVERDGRLERIAEATEAAGEQNGPRTVSGGQYALPAPAIFDWLERNASPSGGGCRLSDAVSAAAREHPVACVRVDDASEVLGVHSRADQAGVQRICYRRKAEELLDAGVTILDPESVWIDAGVTVGPDTVLHPGVTLLGASEVGGRCAVHAGAWLRDSVLADEVQVLPYSVLDGARVESGCSVGPFARLRPEAILGEGARVGNFVEVKKATLGPGVKASHLAYLGDASVGAGTNIGAGVIFCNYDGKTKNRTVIGEDAFIGSDTILVAPVEVGSGAYTGAGSVITRDVPEEALAVGRARQTNIERRRLR